MPTMGVFNNLVVFDPQGPAEQPRRHRARPRHQMDLERGRQDADLRPARGREVARRQAVHRGRRQMHLRAAGRHGEGELQGQLPQGLVRQRRERDDQRRFRGGRSPQDAAARAAGPARLRLHAGLSLPCLASRDAPRADRHRAVQVRRVQGEPEHQGDAQPELLEAGPALSRWHRVHHHRQPLDGDPVLRLGQVRHDLPVRDHRAVGQRREGTDADGAVRHVADERRGEPADEPGAAVRQPRDPPRRGHDASTARRSSTS